MQIYFLFYFIKHGKDFFINVFIVYSEEFIKFEVKH